MTLLTNRLSTRTGNRLVKTGRELTEFEKARFGKSKMMRYVAGTNEPVYPIGYTQHKNPLFRKKSWNYYTPEGREGIHNCLRINIPMMLALMRQPAYLNLTGCNLTGNIYNSTTNILAHKRSTEGSKGRFHDTLAGLPGMDDAAPAGPGMPGMSPMPAGADGEGAPPPMPMFKDNRTPKNLELNLKHTSLTGIVSSALQHYREGLTEIRYENRMELSNVTQTAAPTVNNGVIVTLDADSIWTVTDTSYLTALTLAEGAALAAPDGKTLSMTVDGVETPIASGSYTGKIVLTVA